MQGISFPAYGRNLYAHPAADWTLENVIVPMGANWIAIHFMCYQKSYQSTELDCLGAPAKWEISQIVNAAHELGLRVFMEFGVSLEEDPNHWAGDIGKAFTEEEWQAWFASYKDLITEYAALAERLEIDMFSIGQELESTVQRETEWRAVVKAVREEYSGRILYSSDKETNWLSIPWWDAVDAIGIHPYAIHLSSSREPNISHMVENLDHTLDRLEVVVETFERPVIITEFGYHSIDGACGGSLELFHPSQQWVIDLEEQAACYQAVIEAFGERDWWQGIFWFEMTLERIYSTPNNTRMSPYLKPAENVIREFYGAPPRSTPTSIPTANINPDHSYNIYINTLNEEWDSIPPQGNSQLVDWEQGDTSVSGKAIRGKLAPYNGISFKKPANIALEDYDWLEFDLSTNASKVWNGLGKNDKPVRIVVELKDINHLNASPFSVEITTSPFIENETIAPHEWHHIQIPLNSFGPILKPLKTINIRNFSTSEIIIYVDNVQLTKDF